jgi:YVTN family beta-propeller protein
VQSDNNIPTKLVLSIIVLFVSVFVISNEASAQLTLHNRTLYELVKQTSGSDENAQIDVGDSPVTINVNEFRDTVYVANADSNSISVISGEDNTWIKDIPVGERPEAIFIANVLNSSDKVYVTNAASNSISVISLANDTLIKDIIVGGRPEVIVPATTGGFPEKIYVTNAPSNIISVISVAKDALIKNIPVGRGPRDIAVAVSYDPIGDTIPIGDTVYVANIRSDDVSVISGETDTRIKDIPVGNGPTSISSGEGYVYVANTANNSISVISLENNTWIKDIPVGNGPGSIGVNHNTNRVYVANGGSNSISVISGENNTWIKDIPVREIKNVTYVERTGTITGVNHNTNRVYVANGGSNSISVISGENNTWIKDIPVGNGPDAIYVDEFTNTVYVANTDSNSISVIDGTADKVVAGTTFQVKPFNSGYIRCGGLTTPSPIGQYIYVYSGEECVAKPNEGFEFFSWEENLGGNSTQLINVSQPASPLDSIMDFFGTPKSEEPEAALSVTKFGTFTANFKELPAPIPPQYLATLFAVVASAFIGSWLTPTFIGWRRAKKQGNKLDYYHVRVKSLYEDGKLDKKDINDLDKIRDNITDEYTRGKINKEQFDILVNDISINYREIFKKEINSFTRLSERDKEKELNEIKDNIEESYAKGKISDQHYNLLNKKIESLMSTNENKINDNKLGDADKTRIMKRSPI